jgi:di/tricarboxylate transporter
MTTIGTSPTDSRFTTVGLLAAIGLVGLVLLLPTPGGLPPEAHRMAALFAGVLVLWSTAALRIAVTSLLALALQPLFRLTSLVADRPPTTGAIFGAAVANFMSSVFFFVLVMFAIALAWIVRASDCRPRTRATSKFGTVQAATRAGAHS